MPLDLDKIDLGGFGLNENEDPEPIQLRSNMAEAVKVNPDKHAQSLKLSKQSGVPEFALQSDPEQIQQKLNLDKIDIEGMTQRSPATTKFLSSDFNNSVIAQEDVMDGTLENLEYALTRVIHPGMIRDIKKSATLVGDIVRSVPAGFVGGFGTAFEGAAETVENADRLLARGLSAILPESFSKYLYASEKPGTTEKMLELLRPQTFLRWEGAGLSKVSRDIGVPEERQNIATDISGAVGQIGQLAVTSFANAPAAIASMFFQGVEQQAARQEASGTKGTSLESDLALFTGGIVTAASEKIGLDAILNRIPPKIKNDILRQLTDVALAGGIEALQEVSENVAQGLLEQYTTNPDAEIFQGIEREAITAGGAGAVFRGIINALTPGRARSVQDHESYKEFDGEIEQERIDALNTESVKSKLKERDLESFKQFIREADGDNDTHVFIDGSQTALYLQSKTREEINSDPALKTLSNAVRESQATGIDVSVPVDDFAGDIAGTEHYEALRDHMTMGEESVSPFRQEQHREETKTYVNALLAEAQENASEYVAAQEIYTQVRDQLIDTGTVNAANASIMAQVVPAWATAQAARSGRSVAEIYQSAGLTIEGPQTGELARLEGEQVLTQAKTKGYEGDSPFEAKEWNQALAKFGAEGMTKEARLARAKDQGFDTETVYYHGTASDVSEFDLKEFGKNEDRGDYIGQGIFITTDPEIAERYANRASELGGSANIIPTYINLKNPLTIEGRSDFDEFVSDFPISENLDERLKEVLSEKQLRAQSFRKASEQEKADFAKEKGFDGLIDKQYDQAAVLDPSQIRSINAAFDPDFKDSANLLAQSPVEPIRVNEGDVDLIETGKPMTFRFSHNTESATKLFGIPDKESSFGRGFEPSGRFVSMVSDRFTPHSESIITGNLTFQNPLVVDNDNLKWKETLSNQYDGKTGKELSKALIAEGYDGIVTIEDGRYVSEIVDFTTFDESKALYQDTGAARGYYDPANSIIRLTESADLSTFLHEFAHFMYEMEATGKTDLNQSINAWYKRNATDVAKEANTYLGNKFDALKQDYQGEHTAPGIEDARLDDVTKGGDIYPDDIYSANGLRYYGTGQDQADRESMGVIQSVRGKPNASVTMYRAVPYTKSSEQLFNELDKEMDAFLKRGKLPAGVTDGSAWYDLSWETREELRNAVDEPSAVITTINNGDWVTLSKSYAKEHGESALNGQYKIIKKKVKAKTLFTNGDSINEFGYLDEKFAQPQQPPRGVKGSVNEADVTNYLDTGSTGSKDKDAAIRRAVHEQFARGFETYLMEGKAPSIELRNAFRTFARWLSQIYQALRGDLKVKLDPEMRKVFDRLLATEEQIAAAESRARIEPMFTDAAMAGMTEEEFIKYKERQSKVKDVQSETLREQLIKQLTRQTKAWWKEEKADIIDEEMDRLKKEKVYTAIARLKDGDLKLDLATVKEMVGEEKTDKLGRKSMQVPTALRGMTAPGQKGVHPDEAAAFFGYRSGSEMLSDLINSPKIKDVAEANAEGRMIERHGDILTDGTIEQQADEAVQNEERGKLILHELKIISRGTNQRTLDRQTVKSIAEERIGNLSFREIHPGKYRKAEIRAAQESAKMLAEGNKEGAAQAKARQALNYYLGMAATNAKNETTKIIDRMARYDKKKVREEIQKAEGGYWDQITKILERFEFRKSATLTQVDKINQDINSWAKERMEIDGDGLVLHNAVLNESYVTHWKNVAFSDLQGISDSVKNIEHVARYANKLTRMGEEIEFNKLVDRWTSSMEENVKTRFKSKRTDVVEGKNWGRWAMAQMTKVPFMASWLDGGERTGISHQVMVQSFTEAQDEKFKLWDKAGKPIMDAITNRSKKDIKRHNQKIWIPEIEDNLYGHQIVAVAMNTGNAGNLRKLLLGEGWADPEVDAEINFNNPKLQAVLKHMTESDWQLVQKTWDQMETLYPQLAEVYRRTTGLVPPKVESIPVQTPFGEIKGGYYPVKYDPNRSHKAALNEDKLNAETESMFSNGASIQASVNTGSTNERTGFYAPMRLSLDVVPSHFHETIHYITHHDAVREVNRLTRDPRVAQMIKEKLGPEEYAQLKPWLNDLAKDGREAPTKMFWDSMLQKLRFGVTLGAMGFKASTGIIQISGLSNTIAEVGMANTMQSLRSILGSTTTMKSAWEFAVSNSKVLQHRAKTMDREIKNAMKHLEGKRGVLAAVQEVSMKHIALIQTYMVDLPSWHAAYIKGMKDWGDETRSYQYADWVIENVQGSGATKDLAQIMRGQSETGRMFTMFMTFFSSLWNLERDLVKGAKSGRYSTTNVAAKAMFLFTVPVLFEMIMRGELSTEDDDDDDETKAQKILTKVAMFPIQSVPFVRDVANAVTGDFGYNISPLQSIIEQGTRTIPQILTRSVTDEEITKGQIKGASKFVGAAAGIPGTGQAWATGEHLYDVIVEGEELTLHQILFGPERK